MKCIEYVTCYELFAHYKLMPCSSHGSEPYSISHFLFLYSLLIFIFSSFSLLANLSFPNETTYATSYKYLSLESSHDIKTSEGWDWDWKTIGDCWSLMLQNLEMLNLKYRFTRTCFIRHRIANQNSKASQNYHSPEEISSYSWILNSLFLNLTFLVCKQCDGLLWHIKITISFFIVCVFFVGEKYCCMG